MKIAIDIPDHSMASAKKAYRMFYGLDPKAFVGRDDIKQFLSNLVSADLDSIKNPGESNASQ